MKLRNNFVIALIALSIISCNDQQEAVVQNKSLDNEIDSISYALGQDMANQMKINFKEIDNNLFVQGYTSGMTSSNLLINNADLNKVISAYFLKRQAENAALEFEEVKKAGYAFLEQNKTKKGVQITKSGLQYIVLKKGKGAHPTSDSKIVAHYHGTLLDGTVFESTIDKGRPSRFFIKRVIPGLTEGLKLMQPGAKYKFFVPQEIAYGGNPNGKIIKPFMALIFEVELIEILEN